MTRSFAWLVAAAAPGIMACADAGSRPIVIHAYRNDLAGIRANDPGMKLQVGLHSALPGEKVLFVDYPSAGNDPAGRDIHLEAEQRDWSGASAIAFQIRSPQPVRVSVSFVDRNQVAYTTWVNALGDSWHLISLPFRDLRPNPYFQPPGAKTGAPLDISDVSGISFAPQDSAAGRFAISQFVLLK